MPTFSLSRFLHKAQHRFVYSRAVKFVRRAGWRAGNVPSPAEMRTTPVFINNWNRLAYLEQQLAYLERAGFERIIILDNASTYPPLLEFYDTTPHHVVHLGRNFGHLSLWLSGVWQPFSGAPYIYTDPDIVPVEECPTNFIEHFYDTLARYYFADKVGFGLRITDLPEHYALRSEVIALEQPYWQQPIAPDLYRAPIDTTFALYRKGVQGGSKGFDWLTSLRTGGVYQAQHLPWYENTAAMSPEDQFYLAAAGRTSYWYSALKGTHTQPLEIRYK